MSIQNRMELLFVNEKTTLQVVDSITKMPSHYDNFIDPERVIIMILSLNSAQERPILSRIKEEKESTKNDQRRCMVTF